MANKVKEVWVSGKAVVNAWLAIPSGFSAEVIAQCGFESVTVDMQHGVQDYQSMVQCFQAMHAHPVTPMVRVPWNEPGIVGKVLDAGAYGVICPMINTKRNAKTSSPTASIRRAAPARTARSAQACMVRPGPINRPRMMRSFAADDGDQDGGREHGIDPRRRGHQRRLYRPLRSRLLLWPGAEARSRRTGNPQDLRKDHQGVRQARALSRHPLQRRGGCGQGDQHGLQAGDAVQRKRVDGDYAKMQIAETRKNSNGKA